MDQITGIRQSVRDNEWIRRIQDCRESGKAVAVWCRESGISPKTYYYHLRKTRELLCEQLPVAVAEVSGQTNDTITIHIADIRVELPGTVTAGYLATVIKELKC